MWPSDSKRTRFLFFDYEGIRQDQTTTATDSGSLANATGIIGSNPAITASRNQISG